MFYKNNEKSSQEIEYLEDVINQKDAQINEISKYKDYFEVMIAKPKSNLTSFQSQLYQLLPDNKSASELYSYIVDIGFTELEKENFANALKTLEKKGYYERVRSGEKIIWKKTGK